MSSEDNLRVSERLLLAMHNLCLVRPEIAKTGGEIAKSIHMAVDFVEKILNKHEADGYVKSFKDASGVRRFYLTSVGILKVCSVYT